MSEVCGLFVMLVDLTVTVSRRNGGRRGGREGGRGREGGERQWLSGAFSNANWPASVPFLLLRPVSLIAANQ